jgi:hypothetical protein
VKLKYPDSLLLRSGRITRFYEKVIKVKADVAAVLVEPHSDGEHCQGRPEDVHLDP